MIFGSSFDDLAQKIVTPPVYSELHQSDLRIDDPGSPEAGQNQVETKPMFSRIKNQQSIKASGQLIPKQSSASLQPKMAKISKVHHYIPYSKEHIDLAKKMLILDDKFRAKNNQLLYKETSAHQRQLLTRNQPGY